MTTLAICSTGFGFSVVTLQSFHFDRDDVDLKGFHEFLNKQSHEEREHAEKLMAYQNMRGGRILLQDVKVGLPLNLCLRHKCQFIL